MEKKISIILFSAILLIAITGYFTQTKNNNDENNNNDSYSATEKVKNNKGDVFDYPEKFDVDINLDSDVDTSGWDYYENDTYSIFYPQNINLYKNPLDEEYDNRFKYNLKDEYPVVAIKYIKYNRDDFENTKMKIINDGAEVEIIEINGVKGWYWESFSETKVFKGNVIKGELVGKSVMISDGKNIINIGALAEKDDENIMDDFGNMVSTLRFK